MKGKSRRVNVEYWEVGCGVKRGRREKEEREVIHACRGSALLPLSAVIPKLCKTQASQRGGAQTTLIPAMMNTDESSEHSADAFT